MLKEITMSTNLIEGFDKTNHMLYDKGYWVPMCLLLIVMVIGGLSNAWKTLYGEQSSTNSNNGSSTDSVHSGANTSDTQQGDNPTETGQPETGSDTSESERPRDNDAEW